jgi:hypothetical protein
MSDSEIFLIEVSRPGRDSMGTPVDYATTKARVTALEEQPLVVAFPDLNDYAISEGRPAPDDGDILIYAAFLEQWVAQPMPIPPVLPITVGSGEPNGTVTAATGSLYLRTDTAGGSQLWVKVSGSGAYGWMRAERAPRRRTRREVFVYQGASTGTSFVPVGFQNGPTVTANASSNADASTGAFVQHNTSSTANNVASVVAGSNSGVRFDWRPDLSFGIRTPATTTDIRQWYGLFASTPAASNDPAIEGFGFRYSTGAGDTNYQAWSNDGTSGGTVTDTGVVINGNTANDLRAVVNDAFDAIDFFIDGTWVARHTTDLPVSSTVLNYGIYCTTLTAAARALRWGRITLETRP